jgi:hypothetical protein
MSKLCWGKRDLRVTGNNHETKRDREEEERCRRERNREFKSIILLPKEYFMP